VMLFDSHLHLSDSAFAEDRAETIARAREAGVVAMVTVASNLADARIALEVASAHAGVWSTAGVHPHDAAEFDPDRDIPKLRALAAEAPVVAIGETGLDFHYDHSPRAAQREAFEAQLELACATGLPVVVHSREADAEMIACMRAFDGRVAGVLHCFSGGPELLEAGLDAGWYVSFSGIVTFKKFAGADLVRRVPEDRLLIETDSPYLAPVPNRGKRNEPAFLRHTCEAVAACRGEEPSVTAKYTAANARRFYAVGLPG